MTTERTVSAAIDSFEGEAQVLEGAIGAYILGQRVGWRALYVLHSKKTLRTYQAVLGVAFREVLPRDGTDARRLLRADVLDVSNFWKVVNGGVPGARAGATRLLAAS